MKHHQGLTADEVEQHNRSWDAEPVQKRRRHGAKPQPGLNAENGNDAPGNNIGSECLQVGNLCGRIKTAQDETAKRLGLGLAPTLRLRLTLFFEMKEPRRLWERGGAEVSAVKHKHIFVLP